MKTKLLNQPITKLLFVGLGNPGEKYKYNRHNVGFMMVDYIYNQMQNSKIKDQNEKLKFKMNKYLESEISEIKLHKTIVILAKPQTYMNNSGTALKTILSKYRILNTKCLFIIHDDLDLKLGEYKIQFAKGPKLHNGIESIEKYIKTDKFRRVRIGVDNRSQNYRIKGEKYVLEDFKADEMIIIQKLFTKIYSDILKTNRIPF